MVPIAPPRLLARVADLVPKWGLVGDVELRLIGDGKIKLTWGAPVQREDGPAFLKFSRPAPEVPESVHEGDALAHWCGEGAVRLLERDDDALLLELCDPSPPTDGPMFAALLHRIHVPAPAQFLSLGERALGQWSREPAVADGDLAGKAALATRWLVEEEPSTQTVLLHGDFHAGNVMRRSSRGGPGAGDLVVIDPRPLAGDPAYDCSQMLGNQYRDHFPNDAHGMVRRYADTFRFDAARVAGWAFVKAVGTGNWRHWPHVASGLYEAYEAARKGRI